MATGPAFSEHGVWRARRRGRGRGRGRAVAAWSELPLAGRSAVTSTLSPAAPTSVKATPAAVQRTSTKRCGESATYLPGGRGARARSGVYAAANVSGFQLSRTLPLLLLPCGGWPTHNMQGALAQVAQQAPTRAGAERPDGRHGRREVGATRDIGLVGARRREDCRCRGGDIAVERHARARKSKLNF